MAGSFNHLVDKDGGFKISNVNTSVRDCVEALEECWDLIIYLTDGKLEKVNKALDALGYPTVTADRWNERDPKKIRKLKPSRVDHRADGSLKVHSAS